MLSVELQDVTKTFGDVTAVDKLSLSVPEGSIYGFIGPNGSGKTTSIRMIMNIFYPDSGDIRIFGGKMTGACTDRIGYLPEERGLYKSMKVRDVLKFYGELKCGRNVSRDVDRWLERFELADYALKKVQTLSKGMSQKVQFIAAVVTAPELVILDEPFSGLDPVNMEALKDAVLELQDNGTTVIFSTHDMNVAEKMCDFIFMIFKGRKVLDGTLSSIKDTYSSDTIRIRTEGGVSALQNIEGVESFHDSGQVQELRLAQNGDPQFILTTVMARTKVLSFEIAQPSLHDIFIRIAGPGAQEVNHA
ncbi:ABC transporter ATP-binding protein [Candidatus Latescibacterota bacterium]